MTTPADPTGPQASNARDPRWPARFRAACARLHGRSRRGTDESRETLWLILNSILFHYLRVYSTRFGGVSVEDLEDLASQKSMELMYRLESKDLDLSDREPGQLLAFFSQVARNGLMQVLRKSGHGAEPQEAEIPDGSYGQWMRKRAAFAPEDRAESGEFAVALQDCAGKLDERARLVWFFRVFYDMRSKDIAAHPEIKIKPSHVDVILQRARSAVKTCMQVGGHDTDVIPAGVLPQLWRAFRLST